MTLPEYASLESYLRHPASHADTNIYPGISYSILSQSSAGRDMQLIVLCMRPIQLSAWVVLVAVPQPSISTM